MMVSVSASAIATAFPTDADLVFDVRFLPNPHFVPQPAQIHRPGSQGPRYIRSFPQTGEFLRRIEGLLIYLIPHYISEGKSYLTIAFGCTGGRHRSVMLAESISDALAKHGYPPRSSIATSKNKETPAYALQPPQRAHRRHCNLAET